MCQKMVRQEVFCSSRNFGLVFSLARSAVGTVSIRSTSPASSAASRDALAVMMRRLTLSQAGLSPQYWSLRVISTRSPRAKRANLNGPVPTSAFPLLKSSLLAFCAAFFETMKIELMSSGSGP